MLGNSKIHVMYFVFLATLIKCEVSDDTADRVEQSLGTQTSSAPKVTDVLADTYKLSVNEADVPSVKEGEMLLRYMCDKYGGNNSYEEAQMAVKNIKKCFDDIIMFSKLPGQIEEARPKGNLDQVFQKYCRRTDELKVCVAKFLIEVDPCLADDQKSSKYTIENITDAILKFACENEGDYIALFISEKGPQCISSKQPGIEQCIKKGMNESKTYEMYEMMNNTKISDLGNVGKEPERPFSFSFELSQCRNAYKMRTCIIDELKKCTGSTPANVVESIFNLVQKSTTCAKYTRAEIDPSYNGGASSIFTSIFSVIIPAMTILLARTFSS